jgi:uncharacterized 2Fe-2S/4Fe-4S cluster protein (DUF4445 family)
MPDDEDNITVSFQPDGRKVKVPKGFSVLDATIKGGIGVEGPCGGQGTCGKCKVRLFPCEGKSLPQAKDLECKALSKEELKDGIRLACQVRLDCDCTIEIPNDSRMYKHLILMTGLESATAPAPNVTSKVQDNEAGEKMTYILFDGKVVAKHKGDDLGVYGAAIDLGTTTVVCHLVDLHDGDTVVSTVALNPQVVRGDDVITRIKFASTEEGYEELVMKAREVVNSLILQACKEASVNPKSVFEVVFAGNTCMHHFFFGMPVEGLGQAPYLPAHTGPLTVPAKKLGLDISPVAQVYALPIFAGFLGADAAAVALTAALDAYTGNRLAIDIGTNGEIMLCTKGKIYGCTSPAGPAFEGAQISCGMRASTGAISYLKVDKGKLVYSVVGGVKPRGITGSGLVDIAALLLKSGLMDTSGKLKLDVKGMIRQGHDGPELLVAPKEATDTGHDIVVTQKDIRQLQLAKAALASGISIILSEAGIDAQDLDDIYVAGAFGNYIDRHSAMDIGLLPRIDPKKIVSIGNAAAIGAKRALVSMTERARAENIQKKMTHIDLASRKDFQDVFMAHINF